MRAETRKSAIGGARALATRATRWRPGRQSAIAVLAGMPLLGAAIGASADESASERKRAVALVVVKTEGDEAGSRTAVARAAAVAGEPWTAAAARETLATAGVAGLPSRDRTADAVWVSSDVRTGVVTITARARLDSAARALASAVAAQTATLARGLMGEAERERVVIGDFEDEMTAWTGQSQFNVPPRSAAILRGGAHSNAAFLSTECPARPGCGPAARIDFPFRPGVAYTISLWARSPTPRTQVSPIFGTPADFAGAEPVRLTRNWRRVAAAWTPAQAIGSVEFAIQSRTRTSMRIEIDGVVLSQSGAPSPADDRRALRAARRVAVVAPSRSTGEEESNTARSALAGAGGGLLIALAAVGAGTLAKRRSEQQSE